MINNIRLKNYKRQLNNIQKQTAIFITLDQIWVRDSVKTRSAGFGGID